MVYPRDQCLEQCLLIIDNNDFSRASEKFRSILYADATSVFIKGYKYGKIIEIMNN